MPTPFSSIGLPLESVEDLLRLTREMMAASEQVVFGGGSYLRWRGEGGAEVWIRVDRGGHLLGLTPSFDGVSRVGLTLLEESRGAEGSLRDGAYRARTPDGEEAPGRRPGRRSASTSPTSWPPPAGCPCPCRPGSSSRRSPGGSTPRPRRRRRTSHGPRPRGAHPGPRRAP